MKKISVIGLGYVGLVTLCCFSYLGYNVIGTDIDKKKIRQLTKGTCPFYEPELDSLLERGLQNNTINFTEDVGSAVRETDIVFICVGTPQDITGDVDLSHVENVSKIIGENMNGYKVIVEKSTVPVKTAEKIRAIITNKNNVLNNSVTFSIASNPEFLREGEAVKNFLEPERIVIGTDNETAQKWLDEIYQSFSCPKIFTDITTSELIKYACNSFLAMKISYINLMADVCDKIDADIDTLSLVMGMDQRIGKSYLHAGIGYGGSCLLKDVNTFSKTLGQYEIHAGILQEVSEINSKRINRILEKARLHFNELNGLKVTILGLAFKKNTDDIRESQSIKLIERLALEECHISCYDPKAMKNAKRYFKSKKYNVEFSDNPYTILNKANLVFIMTDWDEFSQIDFSILKASSHNTVIIDGKNFLDAKTIASYGLKYEGVGRKRNNDVINQNFTTTDLA